FEAGHPQIKSHEVRCRFEVKSLPIPNFIGGFLPRRDQGDREFYCTVILTLFRPWSSGLELKDDTQLWDEAFQAHSFDPYTQRLIDNLNLKYECMDAKDRLKSQHKKKYRAALGLPAGEDDDFDDFDEYEDGLDEGINADGSMGDHELLGKGRVSRLNQMNQAQSIVASTGWLD
ncbi:hypothetical protein BKA70DRAFT_1070243, partial [Coprinopsis sp. MPI-PUGE-AT-0042]